MAVKDNSIVLDCYLAPRDTRTSTEVGAESRKIRYGYFQSSNFEISEDTMSITTSKIYTYEDLTDYQEGDFIACYLPDAKLVSMGIFGLMSKEAYYVGVIDSVEIVNKAGQPNILNCKEAMSVFDNEVIVSKMSGSSWEDHVRNMCATNFYTYDRFVEYQGAGFADAWSWQFAHQLSGVSMHRSTANTPWRYDPTDPFSVVNMYQYMINGTKKYNVFYKIRGIQWDLPHYYPNTPNKEIFPDDVIGIDQFNLLDVDISRIDDSDTASYQIKDNCDDLFDWEFSTTVGTIECNMVRVFRVDADGNTKAIVTNKDNGNGGTEAVTSLQAVRNSENRKYPYTMGNTRPDHPVGTLPERINDGLFYFVTTRGEIVGNGTQLVNSAGVKRWGSTEDNYAGMLDFSVPDNEPDKMANGNDNMKWYHRFDKYIQTPVKMKQILVKAEDLSPANSTANGGDRAAYLGAASEALQAASYAHQFKIKVSMDSTLVDWREMWLGRSVYVTYKGKQYKSLVTARQLKSGTNYVTIILGHNRHKLGALLQEKLT